MAQGPEVVDPAGCEDCHRAYDTHAWAGYRLGCVSCAARMIAQSPAYHRAESSLKVTDEYKELLKSLGMPTYDAHRAVKAWRQRLDSIDETGNT